MFKYFLQKTVPAYLITIFCNVFVLFGHLFLLTEVLTRVVNTSTGLWLLLAVTAMLALPFVLLFGFAGALADFYDKAWVQRMGAVTTVVIAIWIVFCHWQGWVWLSFISITLFSLERALTSPARYAFVKQSYGKSFIAQGNALIVFMTAAAVLSAIVIFSYLLDMPAYVAQVQGSNHVSSALLQLTTPATCLLVAVALLQWLFTCRLSSVESLGPLPFKQLRKKLAEQSLRSGFDSMFKQPVVLACLTGAVSFWSTSAVLFLCFPAFIHSQAVLASPFGSYELLVDGMLGVVVGSLYAGQLSKFFIESGGIGALTAVKEPSRFGRLNIRNKKVIKLPTYWEKLVDPTTITVNLTPYGSHQDIIVKRIEPTEIHLQSNGGLPIDCFYHVFGARADGERLTPEYEGTTPQDYPGNNDQYSIAGYHYDRRTL